MEYWILTRLMGIFTLIKHTLFLSMLTFEELASTHKVGKKSLHCWVWLGQWCQQIIYAYISHLKTPDLGVEY